MERIEKMEKTYRIRLRSQIEIEIPVDVLNKTTERIKAEVVKRAIERASRLGSFGWSYNKDEIKEVLHEV